MRPRGLGFLAAIGARFVGDALRGRASLGIAGSSFALAVLRSLRPHYFALPAGACLAGAAAIPDAALGWPVAVAAAAAGLGWGVGQLLNDLMDTTADAVDAPRRPAVRGLLPPGPTVTVATILGLGVAVMTVLVHPQAWWLALAAAGLLLAYGDAKRLPLAGNLAHAALIATAAAIGAAAAAPTASLQAVLGSAWPACALSGTWAAIYLQSNYEKDREGDAHAGYRTLAHVLGLPVSATLRVAGAIGVGAAMAATPGGRPTWTVLLIGAGVALVVLSAAGVLRRPDERAARRGYRFAVHGATTGMLALAGELLGPAVTIAAVVASTALTEHAFRRDPSAV